VSAGKVRRETRAVEMVKGAKGKRLTYRKLIGPDPDQERRELYRFVRAWGRRK
jgi:hypothetical protein